MVRLPDDLDEFSLDRSEGGFRLSALREGWDMSLIYYDTADKSPVNFQSRVPNPPGPFITVLQPKHPRLHIVGATLAKSLEPVVLRAEAALTIGKRYATTNPLDTDGVVRRDTVDWLLGVDYTFFGAIDTAFQINQKILTGSATNLTQPGVEAAGHDAADGPRGHRLPRQHAEPDHPVRRERQPRATCESVHASTGW